MFMQYDFLIDITLNSICIPFLPNQKFIFVKVNHNNDSNVPHLSYGEMEKF